MFSEETKIKGHIVVYKINTNNERLKIYEHKNTIHVNMYTYFRNALTNRNYDASIDYMVWGSYNAPLGEFLDGTFIGTGAFGSNSKLVMTSVGSLASKFTGTFAFLATKIINYFQLGRGYNDVGFSNLVTTPFAYDQSLLTGSKFVYYFYHYYFYLAMKT